MLRNSFETADLSHDDIVMPKIRNNESNELKQPLEIEKNDSSDDILPVELSKYDPPFVWIPMFKWIFELKQNWLNDVIAGITVAFILIPQCLAYLLFIIQ